MGMPEVLYANNHFYMIKKDRDFLYEVSPIEALSLSAFSNREKYTKSDAAISEEVKDLESAERKWNFIDLIPKGIEVKLAENWKNKDMSKVKDFSKIEIISDWTFSTTYKGRVKRLSANQERIKKETGFALPMPTEEELKKESVGEIKVEKTDEEIPIHRLGRDNPIIHFGEVYMYEDDLGDQGYAMVMLRYRVMADCSFALLRYYLRVDDVVVRIYDTRIFNSFD